MQLKTITAIFYAHMVHAKDISDISVLAEVAESIGLMNKDEVCSFPLLYDASKGGTYHLLQVVAFLQTDELETEVNKIADAARAKGITGVPVTVIDGKWAVSGGQSSDVFVQVC